MIKRQLPNALTLSNLLCGIVAIVALLAGHNSVIAALLILLGAFFDFFDGLVARLLKVEGAIGKELDSLADVVTFGVAPSLIAMTYACGGSNYYLFGTDYWMSDTNYWCFIPLIMALMSAYRLAKFNIDTRQTNSFLGVPTPLNAVLWLSLPLIEHLSFFKVHLWGWYDERFYDFVASAVTNQWFIIVGSVIMAAMLVIEVPMLALKFKNVGWSGNKARFVFIMVALALLLVMNIYALPFIVIAYVGISLADAWFKKKEN
ncbi:MAG: CDP-alcohol phosphatidyltransferase family protein [Bacteroidales bacterium]|nr:CDP-alcohol phosphatidyltransferase family protein [Bacteroidales bacterium]